MATEVPLSKLGFLFPGQGAQFVGMGRELADSDAPSRELFAHAGEILGYDLAQICFEGPEEQLHATEHSQPALFMTSMAALGKLKRDDPEALSRCEITAGLSLGEYSALCFAGVMEFDDALRVVRARGQAMQQAANAASGGMLALLGLELGQVNELCDQARGADVLEVANLLCPGNIVCSGHQVACDRLAPLAEEAGAMKVIPLTVAGAFHTSLMESAVAPLTEALSSVELRPPSVPVVSNVDAQAHSDPDEIRDLLIRQIVSPVQWEQSVGTMLAGGAEAFYEIGAGKVLRGLLRRINRKLSVTNV